MDCPISLPIRLRKPLIFKDFVHVKNLLLTNQKNNVMYFRILEQKEKATFFTKATKKIKE